MDHSRIQPRQMTTGLTRYRSAPSSYFSTLLAPPASCGYTRTDDFNSTNDDIQQVFARFVASIGTQESNFSTNSNKFVAQKKDDDKVELKRQRSCDLSYEKMFVKQEPESVNVNYQCQQVQQVDNKAIGGVDNSFSFASAVNLTPASTGVGGGGGGGGSSLARYNSSPAGFFAPINIESEYGGIQGIGAYASGNSAATEASMSTPRSSKSKKGFSSGKPPASPRLKTQISAFGDKGMEQSGKVKEHVDEGHKNDESCITDFPMLSWEDSHILTDDFLKVEEDEIEPEPSSKSNEGLARPPRPLSHHLSLPTSTMEKLLNDTVPLNVRAKRGCATHPRSIAERVRRTRISERMRKLQELVPNMDKQTNTADMLDFAVDYIKELETQVKILSENRAKCTCGAE